MSIDVKQVTRSIKLTRNTSNVKAYIINRDVHLTTVGRRGPQGEQGLPGVDGKGWVTSVSGRIGDVVISKADVGLPNVDNTSDINKPISNSTQTALNLKANTSSLSTVATSGSYLDLSNRPTLATVATTGSYLDLSNSPTLSTVATTGAYNDLSGKPTIPTNTNQLTNSSFVDLTTNQLTIGGTKNFTSVPTTTGSGIAGAGTKTLASNTYVQSRGQNLVSNGTGLLLNNYNFTSFTFDPLNNYNGGGSFKNSTFTASVTSDELIPVDPNAYYKISVTAMSSVYAAGAHAYFGYVWCDIDGNVITPPMSSLYPGSARTTLAADLNPGDTTMTLTDATGWYNGATASSRYFTYYGYTNGSGYTYPDYTYSRKGSFVYGAYTSVGMWGTGGISGNVVTLNAPWPGPKVTAGTAVGNGQSGSSYAYLPSATNVVVPQTWTTYTGIVGGLNTTNSVSGIQFVYGTAYVKLIYLMNRDVAGNTTNVANIQMSQAIVPSTDFLGAVPVANGGTGSTTQNWVDLSTTQTVAGAKTFSSSLTSTQSLVSGLDIKSLNTYEYNLTRTIPIVTNDEVDIGTFTLGLNGATFDISIAANSSSFSVAKSYKFPIQFVAGGSGWQLVQPLADSGPYGTSDFALDMNVTAASGVSFRIRRVSGTTASTATIAMKIVANAISLAASTATSSVTAPTASFKTTNLTQINNNVGIGNGISAPPQSLTLDSSTSGVGLYNTADQVTNYERAIMGWATNTFSIRTSSGGTGSGRDLVLSTPSRIFSIYQGGNVGGFFNFTPGNTTSPNPVVGLTGINSASTGTPTLLAVLTTIAQSGTAGYTGLLINPTESSVGNGTRLLVDLQASSASKFNVQNDGRVFVANVTTAPAANATGGGYLYVEAGALKYRGSSGTITVLGAA